MLNKLNMVCNRVIKYGLVVLAVECIFLGILTITEKDQKVIVNHKTISMEAILEKNDILIEEPDQMIEGHDYGLCKNSNDELRLYDKTNLESMIQDSEDSITNSVIDIF